MRLLLERTSGNARIGDEPVAAGGRQVLAAEILDGCPVTVRIESETLMFLEPARASCCPRATPLTRE
jgi:hypothetical protein